MTAEVYTVLEDVLIKQTRGTELLKPCTRVSRYVYQNYDFSSFSSGPEISKFLRSLAKIAGVKLSDVSIF